MNSRNLGRDLLKRGWIVLVILSILCISISAAQTKKKQGMMNNAKPSAQSVIDSTLVGVWGIDAKGGYDFRSDGTFIMEGTVNYRYDASNGVWHYWQPSMPNAKAEGEYKISAGGKSLAINLKKGTAFTNLIRIK